MESLLTLGKFASTKLLSMALFGLAGVHIRSNAVPESSSNVDRGWHEDYLVGKSDMDAVWYYERRRWRS